MDQAKPFSTYRKVVWEACQGSEGLTRELLPPPPVDNIVVHSKSDEQEQHTVEDIEKRVTKCKLELHSPEDEMVCCTLQIELRRKQLLRIKLQRIYFGQQ